MPISAHLLERANQLMDASQYQNAAMVLDAVVRVDPTNVTAWKAYLQICRDRTDKDWLLDRVSKNKELSEEGKLEIQAYHNELLLGLSNRMGEGGEELSSPIIEPEQETQTPDRAIKFELIDEFDYPTRKIERVKRRRSREFYRFTVPQYVWNAAILLVLFYVSVRMLVLGHGVGLFLMGLFISGGIFWLRNLNISKPFVPTLNTHAYSLESDNDLFIIDKPSAEAQAEQEHQEARQRIRYLDK